MSPFLGVCSDGRELQRPQLFHPCGWPRGPIASGKSKRFRRLSDYVSAFPLGGQETGVADVHEPAATIFHLLCFDDHAN